jgi:hypothetical protein
MQWPEASTHIRIRSAATRSSSAFSSSWAGAAAGLQSMLAPVASRDALVICPPPMPGNGAFFPRYSTSAGYSEAQYLHNGGGFRRVALRPVLSLGIPAVGAHFTPVEAAFARKSALMLNGRPREWNVVASCLAMRDTSRLNIRACIK